MSNIISFYLNPFKEAIDFYKQLLKYGNYDPDRYFKLNYGTPSAKEAVALCKPIHDAENSRKERYYIKGLTELVTKAIKLGDMEVCIKHPLLRKENYTVVKNVTKHFTDLGYDFQFLNSLYDECEYAYWGTHYLRISWKYK